METSDFFPRSPSVLHLPTVKKTRLTLPKNDGFQKTLAVGRTVVEKQREKVSRRGIKGENMARLSAPGTKKNLSAPATNAQTRPRFTNLPGERANSGEKRRKTGENSAGARSGQGKSGVPAHLAIPRRSSRRRPSTSRRSPGTRAVCGGCRGRCHSRGAAHRRSRGRQRP